MAKISREPRLGSARLKRVRGAPPPSAAEKSSILGGFRPGLGFRTARGRGLNAPPLATPTPVLSPGKHALTCMVYLYGQPEL